MGIENFIEPHGEVWEILRDTSSAGSAKGLRNTKEKQIGFYPGTDVRVGDILTGSTSGESHLIRNVTKQIVQGKIFCVYASYKEPSGGNTINQHTVNQINSPGASAMMNSPGAVQNMSTPMTADSVEDLKLIVRSLLKAIDQLGLAESVIEEMRHDAGYLKKKLESENPEPGMIRACLGGIKKKLAESAAAAAATGIVTQSKSILTTVTEFWTKNFGTA